MKEERYQRRRQGRYYTPQSVVETCWRVLHSWISAETLREFRVVDPAVGDGVFLHFPCQAGWIRPENALGIELFPSEEVTHRPFPYYEGDGLLDHPEVGYRSETYDLVVGNPPYGDSLLREWDWSSTEPTQLATIREYLERYRIGRESLPSLPPDKALPDWLSTATGRRYLERLIRCPVEVLFVQRFLDLCRPGGWCALVIPDGILANTRLEWLRRVIGEKASLKTIIALPKGTFQREGTLANTSLMIFQRCKQGESGVYLSSPEYLEDKPGSEAYLREASYELMTGKGTTVGRWVSNGQLGEDRWDPGFWNPRFHRMEMEMGDTVRLGDYIEKLTYGPIRSGKRPKLHEQGILVIGQSQFTEAGLDLSQAIKVVPESLFDPLRSRVQKGDLLFPRSGEGSLLRLKAGVYMEEQPANISCFVDLLRLKGINPIFVWLTLKTRFVKAQILRLKNGVGTPNLNFDEIRSLKVPHRSLETQMIWEQRYHLEVAPFQRRRVEAADPAERRRWGDLADKNFSELVRKFEEFLTAVP